MLKNERKKCALYVRVSTDRQAAKEYSSLETQEDVLRKLVADRNASRGPGDPEWVIIDVYREKKSAKDTNRPEFQRLLADIRAGRITMILFIKLDRFSRSLRDFLGLQDFLKEHDCGFISKNDPLLDTSSPHGEFIIRLLLLLAEYERKLTSARTREKMRWRAEDEGLWNGGPPRLGYRRDPENKSVLKPISNEATLVNLLFTEYLNQGSATELLKWLAANGITIPARVLGTGRKVGDRRFYKSFLLDTLQNRIYIGMVSYTDKSVPNAEPEWFPGKHAAIVPQVLFDSVQSALEANRETRKNRHSHGKRVYMLQGLLRCGKCFSLLSPKTCIGRGGIPHHYYACSKANQTAGVDCDAQYVPAEAVEQAILDEIRKVAVSAAELEKIAGDANEGADAILSSLKSQRLSVEARLREVTKELDNLTEAIVKGGASGFRSVQERLGRIEAERTTLEQQAQKLMAEIDSVRVRKVERSILGATLKSFVQLVEVASPNERKALVHQIIKYVVWTWEEPGQGKVDVAMFQEFQSDDPGSAGSLVPAGGPDVTDPAVGALECRDWLRSVNVHCTSARRRARARPASCARPLRTGSRRARG